MPRVSSILAEGVALALLAAAVGGGAGALVLSAAAQDAGSGARPGSTLAPALAPDPLTRSSQPLPGLSGNSTLRGGVTDVAAPDPNGTGPGAADARRRLSLRARQRATRRTRPATVQPYRAQVRAETTSRDVNKIVQVPVVGLPDPVLPGFSSLPTFATRPGPVLIGRSGLADPVALVFPTVLGRTLLPEADPYAPVGIKSGGLVFFPALEQGVGYDSNPNRDAVSLGGSPWLRTDGQLRVASIWSTHQLTADLRGGYSAFPNRPEADRPDGVGVVHLRIDANRDARIDAEARYLIETQRPGSPEVNAPTTASRALIATTGASLEGTQGFNRLAVGLRGSVDRVAFEDIRLPNGTVQPQGDRDQTTYSARLRTAYELRPGLTPFVDVLVDSRIYDQTIDSAGFRRSSLATGFRVGSTYEFARTITGEVSAGYQLRRFDDPRLRDASGPVAQASLIWAATPLTTVRLRAVSDIAETTVPGASAILSRSGTLEVQHDFRRNLSLTLSGTGYDNQYQGANIQERGFSAAARLDYRLTRWLALRVSYLHEQLWSNVANSSYKADSVLVGVRVQP